MNSGFAIYFSVYLNNNTFPGAGKLDYAAIGGLAFGATLMFSPFINFLQGAIGVKNTIIVGNCIQFASLMLASFAKKLWHLYLTQGLLQSAGLALISIPGITILPQFFKRRRVLAGGIATAGSGAGGIVFNLGMQKVVQFRTVFWALRCQSIISFGLVWVAVILFTTRSQHHGIQFTLFDRSVARNGGFLLAWGYVVTCMFGYVVVLYTVANFTTSLGYSEYQGSIVAAAVQAGSCVGRPLVGFAADFLGPATLAFLCYSLSAILCLALWIPARSYPAVVVFGAVMGAIMGTIWGTVAPLLARLVGLKKMNIAFSMLWSLLGMAGIASPVIGVKLVRGSGGEVSAGAYRNCSIFAGVAFAVCALCLFLIRGFILGRESGQAAVAAEASEQNSEEQNGENGPNSESEEQNGPNSRTTSPPTPEKDQDPDLLDPVHIRVPPMVVLKHAFLFRGVKV